ncbi:MAG: hypothetical protein JW839_04230 [Candidatus Lokiarchaeota archaeon]|nr:hypothetical protein [Candidatus Lokiarchaeota archaeon]
MSEFNEGGGGAGAQGGDAGPPVDSQAGDASPGEVAEDGQRRGPKLPVYSTSPKRLWVPIVLCIVGAGLLAICLNLEEGLPDYTIADPSLGVGANLIDAILFIGIGAVAAFILILLVRKRGINALERVMTFAFLVLGTFIIWMYGIYLISIVDRILFGGFLDIIWSYIWMVAAFAIAVVLVWLYASPRFANRQGIHNVIVVVFGVLIGSYLASLIGTWTSLIILMGFALYDIYSVRKGPIKEMMQRVAPDGGDDLTGVDIDDITIDIGIGDLAFYSMLTSITLISAEWGGPGLVALSGIPLLYLVPFAAAVVGVLIGAWISFELVKKNKILPGLPMSIFIGIGLYSLAIGICLLFIFM